MSRLADRVRAVLSLLAVALLVGGCGADSDGRPSIDVAAGEAAATVEPTLYCVDGHAQFAADDARTAALEVKPDTTVVIDVPEQVADAGWTIQIWTVNDTAGGAVPLEQIGNVDAGNARSYDGFTTSDAVPDRYFIIVALPEDPGCDAVGSAGIWTVLVSRVA
ncbi:DUF2771 family protein [Blastococcus sp. Marseille-P5729]|uniref:DUF2771 family protein n=1 Tax=Blastococcus sp. Marseille-P5729 TaxID=2086582 RepID=UPI000D0F0439|nr:DUF2771 family protein [Blastococcus sp. Marseille-P5729]